MSGDETRSREALKLEDFIRLPRTKYKAWLKENIEKVAVAAEDIQAKARDKFEDFYPTDTFPIDTLADLIEAGSTPESAIDEIKGTDKKVSGPSLIKSLGDGPPTLPPESQDIEYLSYEEITIREEINTLDEMKIEDPDSRSGVFIERCVGKNPETGKLRVVRIPARAEKIQPSQVMQYMGTVVEDHQSVHTATVVVHGRRWGYTFDRFFKHNGEKLSRCCLVLDPVHQAGMIYRKAVGKRTRKAFPVVKTIPPSNSTPTYRVIGQKEPHYRHLKRLFKTHFIKRGDEDLAEDIGLKNLAGMA